MGGEEGEMRVRVRRGRGGDGVDRMGMMCVFSGAPDRKMKKLMTSKPPWTGLDITIAQSAPAALPSLFIILFNIIVVSSTVG